MTCSNTTITKRLQPSLNSVPATAGQPLTLAALSINCGQPAGFESVQAGWSLARTVQGPVDL
jgi:hypothetical protein